MEERDRPDEIEVTEAMLDAGREVMNAHYFGDGVYDIPGPNGENLAAVFRAMVSVRPQH